MPTGKHTNPNIKSEIISMIRDSGMSVSQASTKYAVHPKTIYRWLKEGVIDSERNLILELNKLRKENEQLYKLLGRATAEMHKSKR
jgi:transposase-like protein